ncbi:MAG TPA: GNAT family N-acetyltransferase [Tepidisphaeraceae bacterium]|jgi:ribosomal protein S18 acetylase RimI-like enzyme
MIRLLEEVSLSAWPARSTAFLDGWILRSSQGYTRRANSIQPLYPGTLPSEKKIALCEQYYQHLSQPTIFKLTTAAEPTNLDGNLTDRGYTEEARSAVMTLPLNSSFDASARVSLTPSATDDWLRAYTSLNAVPKQHHQTLAHIVRSIDLPTRFATLSHNGNTLSCGMAVHQADHLGLFDIVTHPQHRRQNLGTEVIQSLLQWGRHQGATVAYLQVMLNNQPARRLYEQLKFQERYQYWYRVRT